MLAWLLSWRAVAIGALARPGTLRPAASSVWGTGGEAALAPRQAGLVGDGLAQHAGGEGGDEPDGFVGVGAGSELPGGVGEGGALQGDHLDAGGERFGGGLEAGDGPPEHQLGDGPVGEQPGSACLQAGGQRGLAEYFGLDVTIVRIAFVVLAVVGGVGIPLYLAGLLLIPEQGTDQSIAGAFIEPRQSRSR